jgi:hypothetical protein
VPNPNEYKQIEYKDGNPGNYCYLNIKWVDSVLNFKGKTRATTNSRSEQIQLLQEMVEQIDRQINYLKKDDIGGLIKDEILPFIKKRANMHSLHKLPIDQKENFISYAIDFYCDRITKGHAIFNYATYTRFIVMNYNKIKRKNATVSFDEAYAKHNTSEDYDMNYYY